ncbi:MAG: hypothetical protein ABDI19_00690 [Armatimonadota bacterium]
MQATVYRVAFVALSILLVPLLLFKPFHIDDTVVLHVAANILRDPLRPFAGDFFWLEEPQPLQRVTTNPPLVSYWLALFIALGGYREWWLHLSFMPFVALLGWGMYRLAERWLGAGWGWWATGWVLLSPAVLPGMNVMRDVPALALFVGGFACWVEGLAQANRRLLVMGALLGGLSGVAKYTALFWIPLALLYALQQRAYHAMGWLILAVMPITLWSALCWLMHGEVHLLYLWQERRGSAPWEAKLLPGVVGLGASLLLHWAVLPRWLLEIRHALGLLAGLAALSYWHWSLFVNRPFYANTQFWLLSGGALLGLALWRSVARWEPSDPLEKGTRRFLLVWLVLALGAAAWGVPFQAMRHLLYALPPLVLLLLNLAGKRSLLLLAQGVLSLMVLAADYEYARTYRDYAREAAQQYRGARVWYAGSWGWMFYAEQRGFRKLLPDGRGLQAGDLVIVPQRVYKGKMPPGFEQQAQLIAVRTYAARLPLRTMDFEGAAYYAIIRTNAPFRPEINRANPLERFRVYRWQPQP